MSDGIHRGGYWNCSMADSEGVVGSSKDETILKRLDLVAGVLRRSVSYNCARYK